MLYDYQKEEIKTAKIVLKKTTTEMTFDMAEVVMLNQAVSDLFEKDGVTSYLFPSNKVNEMLVKLANASNTILEKESI